MDRFRDRNWLRLLAVATAGLLFSVLAHVLVRIAEQNNRVERFHGEVDRTETALRERLRAYEQVLRGGVGLFDASTSVSRAEWRTYFDSLALQSRYPGILGLGWAVALKPEEVAAHEQAVRAEGYADFRIWPDGVRKEYTAITYLEPFNAVNQRAFGYDMGAEPVRHAAMQRARETGLAVLSGPVLLKQDESLYPQSGVLMYMPVYRSGAHGGSSGGVLHGYVYAPFRVNELIHGVFGTANPHFAFSIRDRDAADATALFTPADFPGVGADPRLAADRTIELYGRHWQLRFSASQAFATEARYGSGAVLFAGLLITVLLVAIVRAQQLAEARAQALAREMTAAYRESEAAQRAIVDSSAEGILTAEVDGRVLSFNRAAERMFGFTADEVIGRNLKMLMPDRYRGGHDRLLQAVADGGYKEVIGRRREVVGQRRSGEEFPMSLAVDFIRDSGPRRFVAVISDISASKAVERALRDSEERFRLMVDSIRDYAIYMLDAEGRVATWNAGAARIKGYAADEIIGRHFSCFYPPEALREQLPQRELERAAHEQQSHEEGWRLRRDGSRFWASTIITAMRDASGTLLGYSKITRDLTEFHRVQEELAAAHRLRQSIVESAGFSIVATDINGMIRSVNPATERLLWYRADEMIGKLRLDHFHDREEIMLRAEALSHELDRKVNADLSVFTARPQLGLAEDSEWTYIRKDGSRVPVQLVVTALRDAQGVINGYLGIAYDIAERKRHEAYVEHLAHHDALTGLPNRALLQDRLQQAIARGRRENTKLAVLMLDVDHFKRINDTLGHHIGDHMLLMLAERLRRSVRATDSVARMGGDEFVVLLPDIGSAAKAQRMAEQIVDSFSHPVMVGSHELQLTISIGFSMGPDDGVEVSTLLRNADTAMYQAKAAGRACVRQFSAEMLHAASRRLELEGAMRRALTNHEFVMHYEPQISLQTGEVMAMEALIRWNDPQRGTIAPSEFIPVAEESGLIVPIGEWTLNTACREGREIQQRTGLPLRLAVNLSPRQFTQRNLVEVVRRACSEADFDPRHLVLEITEGTLMHKSDEAIAILNRLRAMGVSVSVDDFGVGYSSLAYITRFPIDQLKIDRSFVCDICTDPADAAIAQAIIAMAHGLNISVVAEGVETPEQLSDLRGRACDAAQGYFIGRGAPAPSFAAQGFHFSQSLPASEVPAKVVELRRPPG